MATISLNIAFIYPLFSYECTHICFHLLYALRLHCILNREKFCSIVSFHVCMIESF